MPASLRGRLGDEAATALLDVVDERHVAWRDEVMNAVADRFERRMAEHLADVRVALVREIHDRSFDILKWCFLFWIGQLSVQIGIFVMLIRGVR